MTCELAVTCDLETCDAGEDIELDPCAMRELVAAHLPAGWGWDRIGPDSVLHCPAHRGDVRT